MKKWREEAKKMMIVKWGAGKGLRFSCFEGHFGLTVYIEVASTNNENSWDLETLSSFESIWLLI